MQIKVQVGSWYVVEGSAGDTVTNPETGKPIATVKDGEQTGFLASTPYVITSNDEVGVHKANFKSPLAKLRLLGLFGGGESFALPQGYIAAEFLESTGNGSFMVTDIVPHNLMGARCIVRSGLPSEGASGEYYFFCTRESPGTNTRWISLRPSIGTSYSPYAGWGPALRPGSWFDGVTDCLLNYKNSRKVGFIGKEDSWVDLPELPFIPTKPLYLSNLPGNSGNGHRLYYGELTEGDSITHIFKPAISDVGEPCFYESKHKKTYKSSSVKGFVVGMTCQQALKLAELPAGGGELTVSLPWEAQFADTGVPEALQIAADKGWTIKVQYRDGAESERYSRYADCVTVADMQAVNADFINDLTADGEWIYPLPLITSFFNRKYVSYWIGSSIKKWSVPLPSATDLRSFFGTWKQGILMEYFELDAPNATLASELCCCLEKLKKATVNVPKVTDLTWAFAYCSEMTELEVVGDNITTIANFTEQCKALRKVTMNTSKVANADVAFACNDLLVNDEIDVPLEYPALSRGARMFDKRTLRGWQVVRFVNSIPTWGSGYHELTLGIHVDHQYDEEVLAAIENAEAKGWIVTVQWNGTATAQAASTFGLRRPAIYAQLGTHELPDGTAEPYLDWGHYVTNWEANGYEEFSSVEEAKEHFNIVD